VLDDFTSIFSKTLIFKEILCRSVAKTEKWTTLVHFSDDFVSFDMNQVVNARICKCQQMRWTPRGAHLLAQVRCAVINGDLAAKLAAYRGARIDEVPEDVSRFLEFLQRAAEAEPHAFYQSPVTSVG
jgi:hypothetical protein